MASVRALSSVGNWTYSGDLRSYLLCCFSFGASSSSSSSSSSNTAKAKPPRSATDAELAHYLDGLEAPPIAEDGIGGGKNEGTSSRQMSLEDRTQPLGSTGSSSEQPVSQVAAGSGQNLETLTEGPPCDDPAASVTEAPAISEIDLPRSDLPDHGLDDSGQSEPMANGIESRQNSMSLGCDEPGGASKEEQEFRRTNTTEDEAEDTLFDVSDLQEISRCGRLHVTLDYNMTRNRLNVTVHEATEIPNQERGGSTNTQVRLTLLPAKSARYKTKIIRANENPKYDETFTFKLPKEEVTRSTLRLRLYGCERLTKERMIGECVIRLVNLNLSKSTSQWLTLEPRTSLADTDRASLERRSRSGSAASSSTQSFEMEGFSELLLSLAYNAVTGRLTVEVLQGTNFKYLTTSRPPDTYVRLTLMSANGKELTRSNTSVRKMSPNPVYREKFMFQVVETQLAEVSLMVSVYAKRSLKREELIGWFILGYSNSGEDEVTHWNDIRVSGGDPVERWHVLAEP